MARDMAGAFVGSILLTIFGYLLVPIILVMKGKKYPKKTLKKIVIINGIVVWLIFSIISINNGGNGAGASVFLYSAIAYWLLKKECLQEEVADEDAEEKTGQS